MLARDIEHRRSPRALPGSRVYQILVCVILALRAIAHPGILVDEFPDELHQMTAQSKPSSPSASQKPRGLGTIAPGS